MTDIELVEKRLAFIEACLRDLSVIVDPSTIRGDVQRERFVEHTLQIAIQAAIDVSAHIVADERLGEPATNHALFDLLGRAGWLDPALTAKLHAMTGFRNVLVHGYVDVDLRIVESVLRNGLDDLRSFVASVRRRMPAAS